ncbi:uncharacterized protein LOC106669944 isoform X2 [Cimex lectularius]|uniref:Uncharacterized protein n=1 Tax=Cimex lectularius TaxID=79782 RepID=A0A8I6S8U5_CIMLE|nr:uncharacterized protein LOC106669944 isoform X2 [Cimex lectularius]XP_014255339.1 uncharacterized protein LOC106669944 isoform X2 [Cimex lectularius]XP_014255341.1 uncharacterized protein LOC106669944 isoform X2 [Cimex lectularius]
MVLPGFTPKITTHLAALSMSNTQFSLKKELISTVNGWLHYFSKSKVSYPETVPKKELPKKAILSKPVNKYALCSKRSRFFVNPFPEVEACENTSKTNKSIWAHKMFCNLPHSISKSPQGSTHALSKAQEFLFSWKTRQTGTLCNTQLRHYSTAKTCMPTPSPPPNQKCVIPPKKKEECLKQKQHEWQPVDTIKMPCCCCPTKDVRCYTDVQPKLNLCKKTEYRIPAFSECKKSALIKILPKECCYQALFCPLDGKKWSSPQLMTTKMRQELILGRRRNNSVSSQSGSTSNSTKKDNGCNRSK